MAKSGYTKVVRGSEREKEARQKIFELFKNSPLPDDEILTNLGLYIRSTILAKILYLNELYQKIINIPGVIIEFGTWWGANLALFEAFRSVYEPYNWTRKVIGFDTFQGYPSISSKDGNSPYSVVGSYTTSKNYKEYLSALLDAHEEDNVMSHLKKYEIVKGDVVKTIGKYLNENSQIIIAMAYFDLQLYEPTKKCLEAIQPYLVHGSVIAMDELNCKDFPGETVAFREIFSTKKYTIARSHFLPDRSYLIID
jgi:hypothetical protein